MFRERHRELPVHFYRNFGVEDYARLIANAACLVGNSSSGIREGAFLGVPVVNIGTRQKNRERGDNVVDVNYHRTEIHAAVQGQIEHGPYPKQPLFGDGYSGKRIAELLAKEPLSIQKEITY